MLKYQLPQVYHKLLPTELLTLKIQEKLATCDNCSMESYQKHLKCCTFEPYLPNFLVGSVFEKEPDSSAAKILRGKINSRSLSLPVGMLAAIPFQVEFNQRKPEDFGNREDWLCPYYNRDSQNCNLWRHRGAVCTTFFCKSSYGKKGIGFWEELNDYLTYVEMALMEEALVYLDFSPRQISDCLGYMNRKEASQSELKTKSLDLRTARQLWNGYFDEQEDFFLKTYRLVKELDKKHFAEAMGLQGEELWERLEKRMRKLVAV